MAIINDDKKVLEGRREQLENVEVPLRDQIPQKLKKKLEELKIGQKVVDVWHKGNAQRAEWLERQEKYLQDWDEHLVSSAEGPFEHSSSLHIPMPLTVAKTMHARFYQAIMSVDPPFTAKARSVASVNRAGMVQETMRYALHEWCNNRKGVAEVIDMWLWNWITVGSAFMKLRWCTEYTRFIDVEPVAVPGPPEFVIDPQTGEEISIPTTRVEEQEVSKTVQTFEGPVYDLVQAEDIVFQGGLGDLQKADIVIQSERLNASQLWSLADQKVFDEKAVRKAIKSGSDSQHSADQGHNIKQDRKENRGLDVESHETELDSYHIFEAYLSVDVDNSGVNSEVICWVHERTREILRATFLRRVHRDGRRPFYKIDFLRKPGQDYGTGLIEMLHPLSVEMDAMHNMRIDFGMLATMPFGFYRPTSSIDPEILQLEPGSLIPVDNPQTDVFFPNLGNRISFGLQEEAGIQNYVERLTGVSELSLGVLSSQQGAARTATGARALIGEANANLDIFLQRLNQGWKQALEGLLHMLQQRIPAGLSFRVTGEAGDDYWAQVNPDDIAGDFDLEIAPNSSQSNPNVQRDLAATVLQLTSNPIDMQLGIVTPAERYEAIKNFLKASGVKDVSRFIKRPLNQHVMMSPQEEADMILHGIGVRVLPDMDHEGFINFVQEIMSSDELLGQFEPQAAAALQAQASRHQEMIQNLKQLQAQQRNAQQVQTNAALGTQQASPAGATTPQAPGGSNAQ